MSNTEENKALDQHAKSLGLSSASGEDRKYLNILADRLARTKEEEKQKTSGMVSHGSMNKVEREGWNSRQRAEVGSEEYQLLLNLRTTSTMSRHAWIQLANLYKARKDLVRSEIAFVGARYCDLECRDLMRKWLAVFTLNRGTTMDKNSIIIEANIINQGMADVISAPAERILHEMQMLLFFLEREEVIDANTEKEVSILNNPS